MMMNARNRFPFTPSQWEELEHQALIFKYMMSGVPVPPDLILTVKRSCGYSSSMSSALLSYQPNFGWGCFQMGFGRKVDTEPWRCRRTDGKKWRCSKEAFPDSKYCERHMHRGRNRSRKPVEQLITTNNPSLSPSIPSTNNIINNSSSTRSIINPTTSSNSFSTLLSSSMTTSETTIPHHHHPFHNHPFLSPPASSSSSSSRPPAASCMSPQNNTTHHLFFDSASYSKLDGNHRYVHGMRGGLDDRKIFPEASGTLQSLPDSCAPLTKSSSDEYSHLLFQSHTDNSKQEKQQQQEDEEEENNCFILGSDFKSTRPIKVEREVETRKPFHHFLGEWPQNSSRGSWLEIDQKNQSNNNASFFSKNLSVSMPLSTQDLFATKDRYHIDG